MDERTYLQEFEAKFQTLGVGRAYYAFDPAQNVKNYRFNPLLPLGWALDFNMNPLCSVLTQSVNGMVVVLEEIILPDSNTLAACEEFLSRTETWNPGLQLGVQVYGDSTAAQRHTSASRTDWQIVKEFFGRYRDRFNVTFHVPSTNPVVKDRINCVNAKLKNHAGQHRLLIHQHCKHLIRDLEQVCWKTDPHGNSLAELDWANRDLNVGAIIALAPDLSPIANLLNTTQTAVRNILNTWGPGKFDAELFLDGKAFNPQQITDGIVTGTNVPGATLIPPAFGLGGVNLHTWTGWGSVPHWNAFVANLEMHGQGRFWDPRLNEGAQFPIAATHGFGDLRLPNGQYISPDDDMITSKLQALQFYQLAIPSPQPPSDSFDSAAATRGDELFSGKAKCNNCHVEPLWTDPGWNLHTPAEVCIDSFQANRAPDHRYRTSPIGDLFTHFKGGFYHDGRFSTLMNVVDHYNSCLRLGLSTGEKSDLIQYLLSLTFGPESSGKHPGRSSSDSHGK
jgi:hypothetical protein